MLINNNNATILFVKGLACIEKLVLTKTKWLPGCHVARWLPWVKEPEVRGGKRQGGQEAVESREAERGIDLERSRLRNSNKQKGVSRQ